MKVLCRYGKHCDRRDCLNNECGHCVVNDIDVLLDIVFNTEWEYYSKADDYFTNLRNKYDNGMWE
jgi:hypothetical protein